MDDSKANGVRPGIVARWLEAGAYGVVLLIAVVYLKYSFLRGEPAVLVVRLLPGAEWSFANLASLFVRDLLVCEALLPALLILSGWLLGRRRHAFAWVVAISLLLGAVAANVTYHASGRFPTPGMMSEIIEAFWADPLAMNPFGVVTAGKALRVLSLVGLMIAAGVFSRRAWRVPRRIQLGFAVASGAVIGVAFGVGIAEPRHGRYAESYLGLVWDEFWAGRAIGSPPEPTSSLDAALQLWDEATKTEHEGARPTRAAASREPDLVWIILETTGASDYRLEEPAEDMPQLARLLPHSIVAHEHLTTSRSSIRADFALQTSIGDGPSAKSIVSELHEEGARPLDSLAWILSDAGYETRYYYPARFMSSDEAWMPRYLGFQHVESGSSISTRLPDAQRIAAERDQFERVARALAACSAPPRFVVARTMIGHYPFLIDDSQKDPRLRRFGRARAVIDEGIGRIDEALASCGRRQDAILVLVGDHGPRLRVEEPTIDLQFADRRSFHVPFIVHSRSAIPKRIDVRAVTSHIDVVPTVLDLLGRGGGHYHHEGLSILDPAIAKRVTPFYLSLTKADTAGSTGLHEGRRFYLYDEWNRVVLRSERFGFDAGDILPGNDAEVGRIEHLIDELARVRRSVAANLAPEHHKSHG